MEFLFQEQKRRKKQRKIGIFVLAAVIITTAIWYTTARTAFTIASLLPASETLVYGEFPGSMPTRAIEMLETVTGLPVEFAEMDGKVESITLAVIQKSPTDLPASLLFLVPSSAKARDDINAFYAEKKEFVYSNDSYMVVANQESGKTVFDALIAEHTSDPLSKRSEFKKAMERDHEEPYFVFAQPEKNPAYFMSALEDRTPLIPLVAPLAPTMSVYFSFADQQLIGHIVTPHDRRATAMPPIFGETEKPYNALTLPLMPVDPSAFFAGASGGAITDYLFGDKPHMQESLLQTYLPGLSFEDSLAPLIAGEFGVAVKKTAQGESFVAALHLDNDKNAHELVAKAVAAYATGLKTRAYKIEPFTLKDGTTAQEKINDPSVVVLKKEDREKSTVWSVRANNSVLIIGLSTHTLFVGNDQSLVDQALDREANPDQTGLSLRDGDLYKLGLQPILKNPQLAGAAHIQFSPSLKGISSFSKRRLTDTTETQFQFIFE